MSKKSNTKKPVSKPDKPYDGFPLFSHPSGMWAKKIRGQLVYFGSWRSDRDGTKALEEFNREWPYLKDGRTPPVADVSNGCRLKKLCFAFLDAKDAAVKSGELSPRTFRDYFQTCKMLCKKFGDDRLADDLRPNDFLEYRTKLAATLGVVSLKNEINRVCILFNFAHENELIPKPVSYGSGFKRPSSKTVRKDKYAAGSKLYTRDEILMMLDALDGKTVKVEGTDVESTADPVMKAMFLLGLNCGFGNTDVANLPRSAVDLERAWIDFPRPKAAIPRHIPLWPETIAAFKVGIVNRPAAKKKEFEALCFLTPEGWPLVRVKPRKPQEGVKHSPDVPIDEIPGHFKKLLERLHINGRRGIGFYTLRHCFETYAGECKDQVAVDAIMGHVDSSMAGNDRHRISDDRLRDCVNTVREWLFGTEGGAK